MSAVKSVLRNRMAGVAGVRQETETDLRGGERAVTVTVTVMVTVTVTVTATATVQMMTVALNLKLQNFCDSFSECILVKYTGLYPRRCNINLLSR